MLPQLTKEANIRVDNNNDLFISFYRDEILLLFSGFPLFFFLQERLRNSQILKFDILLPKQILTYTVNCTPPPPPPPQLITLPPGLWAHLPVNKKT